MSSLLPTPEPADPVEGQSGHFEHTNWVKAALKALDRGLLRKPATGVPAGKILGTSATDTWSPLDPSAIGGVPAGVIVAYNGDAAPPGWAFCNGQNGTPDLRNRFILGATTPPGVVGKARGSQGGVESVKLTSAQSGVPSHGHTTQNADAAHGHTVQQRTLMHTHGENGAGGHNHTLSGDDTVIRKGDGAFFRRITGGASGVFDATGGVGDHSHVIHNAWDVPWGWTLPIDSANAPHNHGVTNNTPADATQAHDNMPPYYALVYIIKL
jgi:microcystin-dependent protein